MESSCPFLPRKVYGQLTKRIPANSFPQDKVQFWMLSDAGRKLGELYVHYEEVDPWPVNVEKEVGIQKTAFHMKNGFG